MVSLKPSRIAMVLKSLSISITSLEILLKAVLFLAIANPVKVRVSPSMLNSLTAWLNGSATKRLPFLKDIPEAD